MNGKTEISKTSMLVSQIDLLDLKNESMFDIKAKAGRNSKTRRFNHTQLNY